MKSVSILILCTALCVQTQLKLEISSEDLIVPEDKHIHEDGDRHINEDGDTMTSSESAKLDFVRRRRRKMLTSTVSPSLKGDPKEPRITVSSITIFL